MIQNNNQYKDNTTIKIICNNFFEEENKKYENFRRKNFCNVGDSPIKYLNDMYTEIEEFLIKMKSFHISDSEKSVINQLKKLNINLGCILFESSIIDCCKKIAHLKTLPFFYVTRNIFFKNFKMTNNYKINSFNVFIYRIFDEFGIEKEELETKINAPKIHFILFMENEISYMFNKLVDCINDPTLYLPPTKKEELEVIDESLDNYCISDYSSKIKKISIHLHLTRLLLDSPNIKDELYKYEILYVVNTLKKTVKHLINKFDKKCFENVNQLYDQMKHTTISYFEIEQKIREYRQNKGSHMNEYFILNLLLNKNKK
ncbi:Hypothetical protein SRAE_X000089100 [Strongyloides ratti]|uniref:Uncharacterized protein n=1 Tax=Strongyloides ratti TaxID=34506 RepID=A0A090LTL8_STRRB|nr:Hypothetical protein SRAE_X000089100 [Strongyloides ratti]CEF71567.1 Hypothetical protein SRAE_X000089100 [Strongyloides ratti]